MKTRTEQIKNLSLLDKRELELLGGMRIIYDGKPSAILPIKTKEFYDASIIYSKLKNKDYKDSLQWEPCEEDKKENIKGKYEDMERLLLSFGGNRVCIPGGVEEDYQDIMKYGQFWLGKSATMKLGTPSRCHENSCLLWAKNKETTRICTGYALSYDGIWRQHSWVMHFKASSNQIVETTKKRVAYFGFIMDEEACNEFFHANV